MNCRYSLSVAQLADILDEKPVAIIKFLMTDLGVMASMTQNLDPLTCIAVAEGFGRVVGDDDEYDDNEDDEYGEETALSRGYAADDEDPADLQFRPPVVTIMGHVDHGKTSLLDTIRSTRVTAGEAGGITQKIAAYQVNHKDQQITFIDTPGHAAFTDMRERGANMTDIVILVVAADDGVKQQTADSITCARQAGVPIVVAVNKCDLETADPMKVMTELTAYDLLTEDFGGDVLAAQISARKGTNIDELLDKVMLQAEVLDLKANPNRDAEGIIVEAFVEKGWGTVATVLVKKGTLKVGDVFVAGETCGKVRALISTNDEKTRLESAPPSQPVRVVGFEGVPSAGDILVVAKDEQTARELADSRKRIARERESSTYQAGLMSSVANAFGANKEKREMFVVIKADLQGSAEALARALGELKLENDEAVVTVRVLVSEAGEVTKSDVAVASVTPGTRVIAFNTAASFNAMEDARSFGIPIEYYNIIYDAIESVESRMQEVLSPTPAGEFVGAAVVQEVFNIGGTGNIAGSRCTKGYLRKGGNVRVMRGDKILVETKIKSLRSFKSEVDMLEEGNDCGIGLVDFETFQPNDIIECYIEAKK
jgi:translation initiation factor IF-2